jgi:hypothetical protein
MGSRRKPVFGVCFSPDGRWLGSLSIDSISLWNLASGLQSRTLKGNYKGGPNGIAFGQNAGWIAAVGAENNAATLWDPRSGDELRSLPVKTGGLISPVAFSADGRLFAAQGDGCCAIKVWETAAGNELRTLPGHIMGITALGFTPEGRLLASGSIEGTVKIWDVASGHELNTLNLDSGLVMALVFSPDGKWLATTSTADANVRVWETASGQELHSFPGPPGNTAVAFSPDGRLLATYGTSNTIQLWEASTGRPLGVLSGNTGGATVLSFSPDGHYLVSGTADGDMALWEMPNGEQLLSLISTSNGTDWLVIAPDGLFDGSPPAWKEILWRPSNNTLDVWPVEIFFNEYFYPGLLADILAGKRPQAHTSIGKKDRRQPIVQLALASGQPSAENEFAERNLNLRLAVNEAAAGSGVRDVRLFRNGSLVKVWRGDLELDAQSKAALEAAVPIVAGENRFTAYAFNHDNIKSSDATLVVKGADSLKRKGTAYIVAVGINQYANPAFHLKFAVPDSDAVAKGLSAQQAKLGTYANIAVIPLLDSEATKGNFLLTLERFAGTKTGSLPAGAPAALRKIKPAQAEDAVVIYFAGHGYAAEGKDSKRFYLIMHEFEPVEVATKVPGAVSDVELSEAVEKIDARLLALLIDACQSGGALDSPDPRQGPMNSKGLAQLAYDKGMYVLAAAQGDQAALEVNKFGHGLLTHALVGPQEGLTLAADLDKDGKVVVREWLDYATERVPQLQEEKIEEAHKQHRSLTFFKGPSTQSTSGVAARGVFLSIGVQRPRVFYRREAEAQPFIVAIP